MGVLGMSPEYEGIVKRCNRGFCKRILAGFYGAKTSRNLSPWGTQGNTEDAAVVEEWELRVYSCWLLLISDGVFKIVIKSRSLVVEFFFVIVVIAVVAVFASPVIALQATAIPAARLIQPDELVKILQSSAAEKPLMIQVGSHVLYAQAHIPGSEYIGPASSEAGLQQLRKRVESLPKAKFIVLYCGCCPWSHCPNIKPAFDAVVAMGFTNVKVLYIADNFGTNWVDKGYPVAKGE
jgi:thiosulfate/3-mercaptopyruvate sulfurtransferase